MIALLRRDLSRDYHPIADTLQTVRGQIQSVPTARSYYSGRIEAHCRFDDFVADTPLNRVLKAAAREISLGRVLTADVRREALRIVARLGEVGVFDGQDLLAVVDRRTWYYRDALALAKHILRSVGRTFEAGSETAWTFLVRTPDLVEAGLRQTLVEGLTGFDIRKSSAPISGMVFGAHPDVVVDFGAAVADVKYKLTDGSWYRPDLYEIVAFASAFRSVKAALICFANRSIPPNTAGVGDVQVTQIAWNCDVEPDRASIEMCKAVRLWAQAGRGAALTSPTALTA